MMNTHDLRMEAFSEIPRQMTAAEPLEAIIAVCGLRDSDEKWMMLRELARLLRNINEQSAMIVSNKGSDSA